MIFSIGVLAQIILHNCHGLKKNECINILVSSINGTLDCSYFDRSIYSKLLSFEVNIPLEVRGKADEIEERLNKTNLKSIANNLEERLSQKMDSHGRLTIAKAIIWCFSNESFKPVSKIFRWTEKTREAVISMTEISNFWEFLAETLVYCYQNDNKRYENYRFKISDHDKEINSVSEITIADKNNHNVSIISKSEINNVFHLEATRFVKSSHITINFHTLDNDGDLFDYSKLKAFLSRTLERYVFSIVKVNDLHFQNYNISQWAEREIIKEILGHSYNFHKELGDILVFSFCEGINEYPKILTNYEIQKAEFSTEEIGNYGMHFAKKDDGILLVLTASSIDIKLSDAIKACIDKSKMLATQKSKIRSLISPSLLRQAFEDNTANELGKILVNDSIKVAKYGYTLFIGYSFNHTNPSLTGQIQNDIEECVKYIESAISNDTKMAKREIDIYLVPFNDASKDPERILKDVIGL